MFRGCRRALESSPTGRPTGLAPSSAHAAPPAPPAPPSLASLQVAAVHGLAEHKQHGSCAAALELVRTAFIGGFARPLSP
eukprot:4556158-Pyramimonas_sp.AAC.1